MRGKKSIFFVLSLIVILLINNVNSEVIVGNKSHSVETTYGSSQQLKGWINISLKDEPGNTRLSVFNNNITLIDFLNKNNAPYTCRPIDCLQSYYSTGSELTKKTYSIPERDSKTFGIKISGIITKIDNFYFNLSSDSLATCLNPVKIDLFDDGLIEWKYEKSSVTETCSMINSSGCYREVDFKNYTRFVEDEIYCEKVKIPPVKHFRLAAKIKGNGSANFNLSLVTTIENECSVTTTIGGDIFCYVKLDEDLTTFIDAEVCIRPMSGGSQYEIPFEDVSPCGYIGENKNDLHDFALSVTPIRYEGLIGKKIRFNQELVKDKTETLNTDIYNYLNSKYKLNCTPECIIPIRIDSGIKQNVTIESVYLEYRVSSLIPSPMQVFYDIEKRNSTVSLDFRQLFLESANLMSPVSYGESNMTLRIGDKLIFSEKTNTKRVPKIIAFAPLNVSALTNTRFIVGMEENIDKNYTYTWKLDNSSSEKITTENYIDYTYTSLGEYPLTLKVKNTLGGTSQTFKIKVGSPSASVNTTIKEYKTRILNFTSQLQGFETWVIKEAEKKIDIDSLNSEIKKQEDKSKFALSSDEYVKIMNDLLNLKIPKKIRSIDEVGPIIYVPSDEQMIMSSVEKAGLEVDEETVREDYFKYTSTWLMESLNSSIEYKTYIFDYGVNQQEMLFTHVKLRLNPKTDIEEVYVIINGDSDKIKFPPETDYKDLEEGVALSFETLEKENEVVIEFLYPDKMTITNLPIFIGTNKLLEEPKLGECNNNNVCDRDNGESYKNCRSDCKPWEWTLFWLVILLIFALVVYILLQEWYKRRYESYLFKDKVQLFNLINFIYNSSNQGLKKEQIFESLKQYKWSNEQLEYAYRKFKGQRTGMWEIPLFKWFENKQVKKEIAKRQPGTNVQSNMQPRRAPPR
ncbi:MAG: PKD domain-containing protein [Candidatus Pacearchaeota archaeon]|jgi:hypothetical protein